ncbi:DNA-binding NarL/FixJ family response regulator [Serratia fonticola]|uniref:DNA-binding NarL/FixJ family response regulator n=1 Tax=Serratia fonticola TaxID=47917 RepID=A0A542D2Z6_SERFO|nr:LuxR C-terminal-related transcriptional regulator [Serratia fonticola]TQI80520.1 DNA-binding NarL/FixJ family response regulator [Serratia fonticola]TQI97455.1 DNA-binding NarL/FixJ family response regulator [Serratia fonticola]TVZ71952.1 DNA-binding NarL/FixJ family response regulator [Serratia fonticola]
MMNILYFGEENIESLGILHIIKNNYPQASIEIQRPVDCKSGIKPMQCDICIVDSKKLVDLPTNEFNRLLSLSNVPTLILAKKEQPLFRFFSLLKNIRGIVEYDSGVDFFLNAINIIVAGGYCYSWNVGMMRDDRLSLLDENYCESVGLTRREIEILKMYLEGASNKEISYKLCRSQKTISAHKSNILRKTGIKRFPSAIC